MDAFLSDHVAEMYRYSGRYMILLIDLDNDPERLNEAKTKIPADLSARVFLLGALSEPEALRTALGSYETIGSAMGRDCREETEKTWGHDLLRPLLSKLGFLRRPIWTAFDVPLVVVARPASENLTRTCSKRHSCIGIVDWRSASQFGQHPVADGNLILLVQLIVREISDLHSPEGKIRAKLDSSVLRHNVSELDRLRGHVRRILFL
jgi:hypothetical protein